MSVKRKVLLVAAPIIGAAGIGAILATTVPALAASPSPSPAATTSPSTTAPAQGSCPNM